MKPVINVKKFGNTATIYLDDIVTANAVSISSFEDEPEGAFPQTVAIHKLFEDFGNKYDFNFLERPQVPLPTSRRAKATDEMLETMKKTGQLPGAVSPPQPHAASPVQAPQFDVISSIPSNPIIRQMEILCVKLSVAEGKKLKELSRDYQAIKKFIVRVFPNLSADIERIEQENDL